MRRALNSFRVSLALLILRNLPVIANVTLGGPLIIRMSGQREDGPTFRNVHICMMDLSAEERDAGVLMMTPAAFDEHKRRGVAWLMPPEE